MYFKLKNSKILKTDQMVMWTSPSSTHNSPKGLIGDLLIPFKVSSRPPKKTPSYAPAEPTICPVGLVENVLLKGLLFLDSGVGFIIILQGKREALTWEAQQASHLPGWNTPAGFR